MTLGGEGKFYPQMMTVIGFSMIPMLFGGIIGIALISMAEPMTITVSMANPPAAKVLLDNPYLFTSSIIGTLMQTWTAVIIFFGVQSTHKLTSGKSAIVAGIPLVFSILSIWSSGIL
ncbi:MAG: YIP1 family protein [Candidatus Methanoperedens sp.]|nr:YIP1 family protein [Candidatus Methanoperedens sp.]